jgi:hypothetical protein
MFFLEGAPSQIDLFDPKPKLNELDGQKLPESMLKNVRFAFIQKDTVKIMGSKRKFAKHGECGMELSDLLPNLGSVADDLLLVRSMHTDQFNHHPGQLMMQCGRPIFGLPAMGSWMTYGLGSESQNLPGYVVLTAGRGNSAGSTIWQSGFLPSVYSGVLFRNQGDPVLDLSNPPGIPAELQREGLDALRDLNHARQRGRAIRRSPAASPTTSSPSACRRGARADRPRRASPTTSARCTAWTARSAAQGRPHRRREPVPHVRDELPPRARLVERGVRFVNLIHASWDHHSNLDNELTFNAGMADQPVGGADHAILKQRGLLDETLVVWAAEFGRTPLGENRPGYKEVTGRDHHPSASRSGWPAAASRAARSTAPPTRSAGTRVKDPVHINDLHATILHLFGLDHEKLTYRFMGRDFRLTDVRGAGDRTAGSAARGYKSDRSI